MLFGDAAVVRGRTTVSARMNGAPVSARIRFTDVFIRRDGRWQAVASHASTLAAESVSACEGAVLESGFPFPPIGPVAQLAEQQTLNLRVGGSIPPRLTKFPKIFADSLVSVPRLKP